MKKSIIVLMCTAMLGSVIAPSAVSYASENENKETATSFELDNNEKVDLSYYEASDHFNVNKEGNDTVVTITDNELIELLDEQGVDTTTFKKDIAMQRKAGVTKIVWHGQARNGNFDLYLSKNFLNNAYSGGIGVATAVITALFPVATIAGAAATSLVGSIASSIAGTAFKHGQKFVVRKWKVNQRVNQ